MKGDAFVGQYGSRYLARQTDLPTVIADPVNERWVRLTQPGLEPKLRTLKL